MNRRSASLFLVFAGILIAGISQPSFAVAQGTPPEIRFAVAPQIGELVPDLEIVDDDGNPVNLRDVTQGHYTVLTLGCLT